MRRRLIIAFATGLAIVSAIPTSIVLAQGGAADEAQPPDGFTAPSNAALVYHRVWLAADDGIWAEVARQHDDSRLGGLGAAVRELLAAAAIERCDWGIDYEAGPWALMPHLGKLRESASVLRADAARHATAGDMDAAVERLEAMFRMAEHLRRDRLVISALMATVISRDACDATEEMIDAITPQHARRLLVAAELPDDPFAAPAAIRGEGEVFLGWAREALANPDPARKLAEVVALEIPDQDESAVREMTPDHLERELDRLEPFYETAAVLFDGPNAPAQLRDLEERVMREEFGVFGRLLAPSIIKLRETIDLTVQQRQDLIARLATAADG